MPATIQDVARRAAVSTATVSRVLNNPQLVNPETRQHVQIAIDELGYRVNAVARSLRTTQQSYNIAAVVDNLSSYQTIQILEAFESRLLEIENGYSLQMCLIHNDANRALRYLNGLQGQVDGILWMAPYTDPQIYDRLTISSGNNVLLVDAFLQGMSTDQVRGFYFDYRTAYYQATRYLLHSGYERIGLINLADDFHYPARMRILGYQDALREGGVKIRSEWVYESPDASSQSWVETVERMFTSPSLPQAVIAFDDDVAAQIYRAAGVHGFLIPDDLAVMGCGNFPVGCYLEPCLTTFTLPMQRLGQEAANTLLMGEREWGQTLFTPELVIRESTLSI